MDNLSIYSWDLCGTYHGIHGSPVYLQEHNLEKSVVSQRKNLIVLENSPILSFNQIILSFKHHNMFFLLFRFVSDRYAMLSNNVKNNVFQTMHQSLLLEKNVTRNLIIFLRKLSSSGFFCE